MLNDQFIVTPDDIEIWYFIENCIKKTMNLYNFKEIRTSILQSKVLYEKHSGFSKRYKKNQLDHYLFNINDENDVCLRPEGTISVLNTPIIEKALKSPQKIFYQGPMFLKNKTPRTSLINQYHQVGAEIIGSKNKISDVEIILLAKKILSNLGFQQTHLELSSHGCDKCYEFYLENLNDFLQYNYDTICDKCRDNLQNNILEIYECQNSDCQNVVKMSPKSLDYFCYDCIENFKEIKKLLSNLGIDFTINTNLLLNFDYYTRLVFRFIIKHDQQSNPENVKKDTVLIKGGRYDSLSSYLTGQILASVGFSFNIEESLHLIKENYKPSFRKNIFTVCIGALSINMEQLILQVAQDLYSQDIKTILLENILEQNHLNDVIIYYGCNILLLFREDLILEGNVLIVTNDFDSDKTSHDILPLADIMNFILLKKRNFV